MFPGSSQRIFIAAITLAAISLIVACDRAATGPIPFPSSATPSPVTSVSPTSVLVDLTRDDIANADVSVLYAGDGNHATEYGSYLNSCVFFFMLTGKPLPKWSDDPDAAPIHSAPGQQLDLLSDVAWESVQQLIPGKTGEERIRN